MELKVRWRYDDHWSGKVAGYRSGSRLKSLEFVPLQVSFEKELKDGSNSHRKVVMRVLYGSEEEVELGPVKLQDALETVLEHILVPGADLDTPELVVVQRLQKHKLSDFSPRGHPRLFRSCLIVKENERHEVWSVEDMKSYAKLRVEELVRQHPSDSAARTECHVSARALHFYKLSRHSKGKVVAFLPKLPLQFVQFNESPLPVLLEETEAGPSILVQLHGGSAVLLGLFPFFDLYHIDELSRQLHMRFVPPNSTCSLGRFFSLHLRAKSLFTCSSCIRSSKSNASDTCISPWRLGLCSVIKAVGFKMLQHHTQPDMFADRLPSCYI